MSRFDRLQQLLKFDNWPELLAQRVLFRGTNLQVHRVNGVEMIVDLRSADSGSIRHCIGSDAYRQFTKQLDLPESINVLDAGANAGGFSLMLMVDGIKLSKLVCVEMNPRTCQRLRFNVEHNKFDGIVLNGALVGQPRILQVQVGVGSTSDSIYKTNGAIDCYDVGGLTLDRLYEEYFAGQIIDICKIDIEGAEREVFAPDAHSSALKHCRYLITELHHQRDYDGIMQFLSGMGFEILDREPKENRGVHLLRNGEL